MSYQTTQITAHFSITRHRLHNQIRPQHHITLPTFDTRAHMDWLVTHNCKQAHHHHHPGKRARIVNHYPAVIQSKQACTAYTHIHTQRNEWMDGWEPKQISMLLTMSKQQTTANMLFMAVRLGPKWPELIRISAVVRYHICV